MEYSNSQIRCIIEDWVHSERDREVLCYRLIDGLTFEGIANRYQAAHPDCPLSTDTVKRIIKKCEPQIFKHIDDFPC